MSFATFAILVFAFVALILIVSRWSPSSSPPPPGQQPLSPPVGPPCPNCGQTRGHVDQYCRRCGQQLWSQGPPDPQE
jgi:hypothetical protein